jgi:membrane protein YdbS with pleckstrin-like domain
MKEENMEKLHKNAVGVSLGIIFLMTHVIWIFAIASGLGETLINLWNNTHFIDMNVTIMEFNIITAFLTSLRAFIGGYIIGWIFAFIYNKLTGE